MHGQYYQLRFIKAGGTNTRWSVVWADPAARAASAAARACAAGQPASEYAGVSWHKHNRRWEARISHEGRQHFLGLFAEEKAAARAYDEAARRLRGDKAYVAAEEAAMASPTAASLEAMGFKPGDNLLMAVRNQFPSLHIGTVADALRKAGHDPFEAVRVLSTMTAQQLASKPASGGATVAETIDLTDDGDVPAAVPEPQLEPQPEPPAEKVDAMLQELAAMNCPTERAEAIHFLRENRNDVEDAIAALLF
eukprot:COSAG04_NODE_185_length_21024_cov_49.557276_4_plen_251_part_00